MSESIDRRTLLKGAAASAAAMSPLAEALAQSGGLQFDPPVPFTYDIFKTQARDKAHAPYAPPARPAQEVLQKINYEEWGKIRYRDDYALFANGPGRFPVTFFHLGLFFQKAVRMHVVDGGDSRQIVYDQSYFDMPANSPAHDLPKGAGFAGLRIQEPRDGALDWHKNDWVAFLGAAYFRSIGELRQYGLSSRGVALDVAVADRPEEFPDFTDFYIEPGVGDTITLYALMEGPSIVGAFKFLMTRAKGVVMDIQTTMFTRAQVSRFGIAPLTSMYWYSETKKETAIDWRPEVHDSDGLGHVDRAAASGCGGRLTIRRASWCRPFQTTIRAVLAFFSATGCSITIWMASITTSVRACGSSRCPARAERVGARGRSSSAKSRLTTRSTTTWSRCGCRPIQFLRAPSSTSTTACTGSPTSPIRASSRRSGRRASVVAASPACRVRRG